MKDNNNLITGIYIRVSTEEQAKEGFSINAQKEKLISYANINNWKIYDFYIDDGISGKNITDRPSVTRLIEDVKNGKDIDSLNEDTFNDYLYTKGLPPVDLLIRTSGEQRTSNYLPYQLVYSEMLFPMVPWPDFTKEEFRKCIDLYQARDRRFGGIKDGE